MSTNVELAVMIKDLQEKFDEFIGVIQGVAQSASSAQQDSVQLKEESQRTRAELDQLKVDVTKMLDHIKALSNKSGVSTNDYR